MDATQLADLLGRTAQDAGWTLVEQYTRDGGVVLAFAASESLYGAISSRERAKSKVAVLTDVISRQVLEQGQRDR